MFFFRSVAFGLVAFHSGMRQDRMRFRKKKNEGNKAHVLFLIFSYFLVFLSFNFFVVCRILKKFPWNRNATSECDKQKVPKKRRINVRRFRCFFFGRVAFGPVAFHPGMRQDRMRFPKKKNEGNKGLFISIEREMSWGGLLFFLSVRPSVRLSVRLSVIATKMSARFPTPKYVHIHMCVSTEGSTELFCERSELHIRERSDRSEWALASQRSLRSSPNAGSTVFL